MEKLDRFYVPNISEFHVGFECEKVIPHTDGGHQISLTNIDQKSFIIRDVFDMPTDGAALSWFRVKYLDKEDIESLGFNQLSDDCFNLPIKEYRGRLNQEVRILIRQTVLIYLAMDMNYSDKDNLVLFTGNIKNKSELKKLMYQLNILKDEK